MSDALSFTPPGIRTRRHQNGDGQHEPAPKISAKLTPILAMVDKVQQERDQAIEELRTANARIEQFESRVSELTSHIESERARTSEAKEEAERARVEKAQLETVLRAIRNQAHDALPE